MWGSRAAGNKPENPRPFNSSSPEILPLQLEVVGCPNNELALTNIAFASSDDVRHFQGQGKTGYDDLFVEVAGIVLKLQSHDSISPSGRLGLNAIHRKLIRVSVQDKIQVQRFNLPATNFDLVVLNLEIAFLSKGKNKANEELRSEKLVEDVKKRFSGQVLTVQQQIMFEFQGTNYIITPTELFVNGVSKAVTRGLLLPSTTLIIDPAGGSGIKIGGQKNKNAPSVFKKNFNFEELGIGGLDKQFEDIFRRAFASRVFPPHIIQKLGIHHVKGMLLHGPPGTGKTLIARQLGKALNGKEPKVVNGPEILDKYVGASEEKVRQLFADAEQEQLAAGDDSELHVIIFDEIDAICKSRGSTRDGTGVNDSIVNQLLTKIDGVDSLNNILLIGMTNRKDMLDEALLRPGRLEVQIEIGLPDQAGRAKILQIHSSKMSENSFLGRDVDILALAERTQNFSGAELEGLIKSAASFALKRHINPQDLSKLLDEENVKVTMRDFDAALTEVRPAFGANVNQLEAYRRNGMLACLPRHAHILSTVRRQAEQVSQSEKTSLLTCLLEGSSGSGKTALAASVAIGSSFPFVKLVSADTMVGMSEYAKCSAISKVFDDACKSALSLVILDDIERLLEYVSIGPRFSNLMLQTLLVLIKRPPPEGKRLLVIGTTSLPDDVQRDLHLVNSFNTILNVPNLTVQDIASVLGSLEVFSARDVGEAAEALNSSALALGEEMTIKRLLLLVDMAAQGPKKHGRNQIELEQLYDCLKDLS